LTSDLAGIGLLPGCKLLKARFSLSDDVRDLMHEKQTIAQDLFVSHLAFINGFTRFHDMVTRYQLRYAIATNADDSTLEIARTRLELSRYFEQHMYGISCVSNRAKPDPAVYQYAARQIEIPPESCIAIEDSANGIAAAQAAGMFCIGINTSGDDSQTALANLIVNTYDDIALDTLLS
jgi:beta-phosphoglucomutase-like phosphatase (HAD superfamily)